jgi:NTE family protein
VDLLVDGDEMPINATVVLGGGGVWGVAWMTGLLTGLAEAGVNLCGGPRFIGTSAGSIVSTQLAGGKPLPSLYERQIDPSLQPVERTPQAHVLANDTAAGTDWGLLGRLLQDPEMDPAERGRRLGEIALKATTLPFAQRRRDIVERLGLSELSWPETGLVITGVDARSGELVTFDRDSGVDLVDAVCASCAVPGVWPPAPIGDRHFIDGGVWKTAENAHLAKGAPQVIVVSPIGGMSPSPQLHRDIAMLRRSGSTVALITADERSIKAGAPNLLDPATRKPGAEAGYAQGRQLAQSLTMELLA